MYTVLTLGLLAFAYALYKWLKLSRGHKLPPVFPGCLPIFGHNHVIITWVNDVTGFIQKGIDFCVKSGGVGCGYFLGSVYYGVTDFEDATTLTNALSLKHPYYRFAEPWLGKGLITGSGPSFYAHRKMLNPAFSLSVTYGFLDVFNDQSRRLTDILDGFVGQGPVDPSDAFRNFTLRASCITIFGAHDKKDNDFINNYIVAINNSIQLLRERLLSPLLYNDFMYSFSKLKKQLDTQIKFINDIILEMIERKKEEMKNVVNVGNLSESDSFKAFLDIVLELAADGALSDNEIIDELNTVVSASYETTSQQLTYIAAFLGSFPDEQDKIYKEIMEVVGDRDISKHDIPKLVYTEAFIKECIRMRSVVNLLARYVDKDVKLKNYTLRAGSLVLVLVDGLNREPAWGPDVDEFKPERWLDKEKPLDNLQFSFGYGQRICVGKKYAMVSMKVTVAHLVRMFRLKADFRKMKYKFDLVIRSTSGHEVTFERRNPK